MLMAGLDGIKNKIEPPAPIDKDLYDLPPEEVANVTQVPGSLPEVLAALEADNSYLQEGGVFTEDLITTWVDYKKANEIDPVRLRPTPHEFAMYYDV
jgi:glutamine synthetase